MLNGSGGQREQHPSNMISVRLMKELRKSKCLDQMEKVLASENPATGKCVVFTVPEKERTPYGSQMRSFPHFVYAKMVRFPDLLTHHQLRSIARCQHPFNKNRRLEQICINPFHYERIEPPKNLSVVVCKSAASTSGMSLSIDPNGFAGTSQQDCLDASFAGGVPNVTLSYEQTLELDAGQRLSLNNVVGSSSKMSTGGGGGLLMTAGGVGGAAVRRAFGSPGASSSSSPTAPQSVNSFISADLSSPEGGPPTSGSQFTDSSEDVMDVDPPPYFPKQHQKGARQQQNFVSFEGADELLSPSSPPLDVAASFYRPMAYSPEQLYEQLAETERELRLRYPHGQNAPHLRSLTQGSQGTEEAASPAASSASSSAIASPAQRQHHGAQTSDARMLNSNGEEAQSLDISIVEYTEPPFWCTVTYYELNQRVGDVFQAMKPSLIIDGGTSPTDEDRFCLGQLENISRVPVVTEARKTIGRGARLYSVGGEVYCESLGDSAVFVQSPSTAARLGCHAATVIRMAPRSNLKIFSMSDFGRLLGTAVKHGYEHTYSLMRMCTIRVSFVKGWGAEYRRHSVTSVPCWLEVHLNGPLTWLDQVLMQMGAPSNQCTSFS